MNVVVVGAGLAAAEAVEELRAQDYTGDITVLGSEPHPPYERPPLSKGLLLGTAERGSVFVHDDRWYADRQVDLLTSTTVTGVDLGTRHVWAGGRRMAYDRLLLATGSRPRRLPLADGSGANVVYLRTLEDALVLGPQLSQELLIIGAGWIGLEVAAAARLAGGAVTMVEPADLPLGRVLGEEMGRLFADLHRGYGVDLRLGTSVDDIATDRGRTAVWLSDGRELRPDLVLVAIGAVPNDALASAAGLTTDRGVWVDARLRASEPHVYAAGDVANQDHPRHGRLRVEHWDTAIYQGRHAARTILGSDEPYDREPYFFSDQYDLSMEYVGHVGPDGYDERVLRGDVEGRVVNVVWIKDDCVVAGMHANDWDASDALRSWVGMPASDELRDPDVPLRVHPCPQPSS